MWGHHINYNINKYQCVAGDDYFVYTLISTFLLTVQKQNIQRERTRHRSPAREFAPLAPAHRRAAVH